MPTCIICKTSWLRNDLPGADRCDCGANLTDRAYWEAIDDGTATPVEELRREWAEQQAKAGGAR